MDKVLWPLVSNMIRKNKISNTFGRFAERSSGVHWGWDFYAEAGTPCYAISDGELVMIYGRASDTGNFGKVAVLKFEFKGKTYYAAYCHLLDVTAGIGPIKAGDEVGHTGNSGNAYNMKGADQHLHFEIRNSPRPGPGGPPNRISPFFLYGVCPLNQTILEP